MSFLACLPATSLTLASLSLTRPPSEPFDCPSVRALVSSFPFFFYIISRFRVSRLATRALLPLLPLSLSHILILSVGLHVSLSLAVSLSLSA